MRNALLASSLLAIASLASGCIGCGAYSGAGDAVYQQGTQSLIVCENGGIVANLTAGTIEGTYQQLTDEDYVATRGDNGQRAFGWTIDGTGTFQSMDIGTWTEVHLDQTALDHADVQCKDLTTRSWWAAR
jgi:hypothetical protein